MNELLNGEGRASSGLPPTASLHSDPIRVVVADPDPDLRRTVRQRLESDARFDLVEADSGPEAMAALEDFHPDWVLVDLDAETGDDGFADLRRAVAVSPATRVVGFWTHLINLTGGMALAFGARAVFSRASTLDDLTILLESAA